MYNHEPPAYHCPFCTIAAGLEADYCYTKADDVVLRTAFVTGFISSHWWPRNAGHVILIPNTHHENIYDLPDGSGRAALPGQPPRGLGAEGSIRQRRCIDAAA